MTRILSEPLDKKFSVARYKPPKYPPRLKLETIRSMKEKLDIFAYTLRLADKVLEGKAKTCPLCGTANHVVSNGSDRTKSGRVQKFICRAVHEHEDVELDLGFGITVTYHRPVKSANGFVYFRATTSMEAIVLQALQAVWTLGAIVSGATIEFVERYLGLPKSYAERVMEAYAHANTVEFTIPRSLLNSEIIIIGMDFSSSDVSKRTGLTVLMVGGEKRLLLGYREESTSIKRLLQDLKLFLETNIGLSGKTLVFLSDASAPIASAVSEVFDRYIHIRQVHSDDGLGVVLITYRDGDAEFTVRLRWDLLVDDPAGEDEPLHDLERRDIVEVYKGRINHAFPSETETKRLVVRGSAGEIAETFDWFKTVLNVLLLMFAGKYITSNVLEGKASAKSRLKSHRTVRSGDRLVAVVVIGLSRPPDRGFSLDFRVPAGYRSATARLSQLLSPM